MNIYICVYVVKETDSVPSQLLPIHQWPHGNMVTHALGHMMHIYISPLNMPASCYERLDEFAEFTRQ